MLYISDGSVNKKRVFPYTVYDYPIVVRKPTDTGYVDEDYYAVEERLLRKDSKIITCEPYNSIFTDYSSGFQYNNPNIGSELGTYCCYRHSIFFRTRMINLIDIQQSSPRSTDIYYTPTYGFQFNSNYYTTLYPEVPNYSPALMPRVETGDPEYDYWTNVSSRSQKLDCSTQSNFVRFNTPYIDDDDRYCYCDMGCTVMTCGKPREDSPLFLQLYGRYSTSPQGSAWQAAHFLNNTPFMKVYCDYNEYSFSRPRFASSIFNYYHLYGRFKFPFKTGNYFWINFPSVRFSCDSNYVFYANIISSWIAVGAGFEYDN